MSELDQRKRELQELIEARKRKNEDPKTGGAEEVPKKAEVLTPKTPKEKFINFWYHYKFSLIVIAVVIVFFFMVVWPALFPERFDATITIASEYRFDMLQEELAVNVEQYVDDIDGNGEKNVEIAPFWVTSDPESTGMDMQYYSAILQRLALWPTSYDHFLYLMDEFSYNYMVDVGLPFMDLSEKLADPQAQGDKYYIGGTALEEIFYVDESQVDHPLFLCVVDYDQFGENITKDSAVYEAYLRDWALFENLLEVGGEGLS